MRKFILFFSVLSVFQGFSQQDAIYSQYLFNQFVINPAYAGSRNSISTVLIHRTRWQGMDGAPTTSSFSVHSGIFGSNLAWGANVSRDQLGATSNILAGGTIAYHLKLPLGKLSFGLRAGVFASSLQGSKLEFSDPSDPLSIGNRQNSIRPNVDFGVYYYTRKFYLGFALNHLIGGTFAYTNLDGTTFPIENYNILGMGYAFEINNNFTLKPSLLLRANGGASNVDLSLSALLYERIWFGFSLRSQTSINFLFELNITDYMRVGYAYDSFVNGLKRQSGGAHELFLGFDFSTQKPKTVSPRYL